MKIEDAATDNHSRALLSHFVEWALDVIKCDPKELANEMLAAGIALSMRYGNKSDVLNLTKKSIRIVEELSKSKCS